MPKNFTFDNAMREELRAAYKEAADNGVDSFMFRGNELIIEYAKYLLEYLDLILE